MHESVAVSASTDRINRVLRTVFIFVIVLSILYISLFSFLFSQSVNGQVDTKPEELYKFSIANRLGVSELVVRVEEEVRWAVKRWQDTNIVNRGLKFGDHLSPVLDVPGAFGFQLWEKVRELDMETDWYSKYRFSFFNLLLELIFTIICATVVLCGPIFLVRSWAVIFSSLNADDGGDE